MDNEVNTIKLLFFEFKLRFYDLKPQCNYNYGVVYAPRQGQVKEIGN